MVDWLGYRIAGSPFPVNADLVFQVNQVSGLVSIDASGNPSVLGEELQFGCYLIAGGRASVRDVLPGLDIDRLYMSGRVIERVENGDRVAVPLLDPRVRAGMVARCRLYFPTQQGSDVVQYLYGSFQLDLPVQSPWSAVRSALGDSLGGYFQQESIDGNLL